VSDNPVQVIHEPAIGPVKFEPVPVRVKPKTDFDPIIVPRFHPDGGLKSIDVSMPGGEVREVLPGELLRLAGRPRGGDPRYLQILEDMRELHVRKAADYGDQDDNDPLANIRRGAKLVRIPAWQGAMLRANDKVVRIEQYIKKGTLANEGVEDSLMDLAAYALLALVLFRENGGA
jgi:hypothetical protein